MIRGVAALGSLALDPAVTRPAAQQGAKATQGSYEEEALTFLHQEVNFKATPRRIYEILLDSKQFAAFSGGGAQIEPKAGGAFSMFDGMIVGRNIELLPDQRIVQAWRPTSWDPGVYSLVKFELKPRDSQTLVILDHTGFPQGKFGHLNAGWKIRYWEPLEKYLG